MSKHTPGPWGQDKWGSLQTEGGQDVLLRGITTISAGSDERIAEAEANTRLIAAAPELLEACQSFSRLHGRLWDVVEPSGSGFLSPESVKEYDAIHELMTTAIAKATGQ
ncbi:TPA: hypothetical protein SL386_001658 [Pseudomonas aeruginosa]|uniref:hypothetical protein n=1 Tax=Pseudomonas aeruginosa TaxID=287 RepID=UPI001F03D208|nr:hypothetical protein [Pseudomonas aeruginosa]HEJ3436103.1 hypothetical protein [Pseudomonas aeruginosa]HEJ6312627.1 hypothetical protein [Pseudomonas aeruginosa]